MKRMMIGVAFGPAIRRAVNAAFGGTTLARFVAFLRTKRTTVVLLILAVAYFAALYGGLADVSSGGGFRYDVGIPLFMLYLGQLLIALFLWFRLGPIAWLLMFAQFVIGALTIAVARGGGWVVL